MNNPPFRVLYREFLFRIVDLELLAPQGDITKLLGQFAALLLVISLWLTIPIGFLSAHQPVPEYGLVGAWIAEHFLIATTMLVVGLFAVLSWDSAFPDRKDVLVLSPLPLRARTLFLAKVAAVATGLSITVVALNVFTGLVGPFGFAAAPVAPPPKYAPAIPPVTVGDFPAVLSRDLASVFAAPNGALAPGNGGGVAVGILKHGERRILTYGIAKPASIFEIGSISKTFTGLLLARMIVEGKVKLDEPVRDLLPPGIAPRTASPEITLLDLATHRSGLPPMPDNFNPQGLPNPFADYREPDLLAFLARHGLAKPRNSQFLYSNLGFAVLGEALARRAGGTYFQMLPDLITAPLGLHDTAISLDDEQQRRVLPSYDAQQRETPPWNLVALAPAGAIRSTAGDLLTYLDAQLHPDKFPALTAAIRESHSLHADGPSGSRIALAWVYDPKTRTYWHNGTIAGFTSQAFFHPQGDYAGVVLFNRILPVGFTELLGQHIGQRLAGAPAVILENAIVDSTGGVLAVLRTFGAYWFTTLTAGIFVFCLVLTVQGLAQLLPRQTFLRVSSFLQLAFFALFVLVYFLQPPFSGVQTLTLEQGALRWLPSYWFFGMFQQLNGPFPVQLEFLWQRAWIGLALTVFGAAVAYGICYFRTLRKIAEQPDILPTVHRLRWLPPFGGPLATAIGQFSVRTLLRSRQHRVILSFYLGIAFGLALFISKANEVGQQRPGDVWYQVNAPWMIASALLVCASVVGARVLFSMPLELRANWIFRVMPLPGVPECLSAARRALYGLAVGPVWLALAVALFCFWPPPEAAGHLAILLLLAAIVAELCLYGFRKIPFTCSYLPGKSYFNMAALAFAGLMFLATRGADLELSALKNPALYTAVIVVLGVAAFLARRRSGRESQSEAAGLQFDDEPDPTILPLGLHRDGVMILQDERPATG
jgi:CubicO group peptidase (beta-lactamase class C family)